MPDDVDVLIVGCGPTGLTLAAQLAAFPDISVCIVDLKPGPLQLGQADGIACRTMEMFQAFGFAERVEKEAYWVNETVFWKPDPTNPADIARSGRIQDVEDGLSEFPHVILNQARVHDFYLDVMRNSPARLEPHYNRRLVDLAFAAPGQPTIARFERASDADEPGYESISARYVIGCDGARSVVRTQMGRSLSGDAANQAWGVMDVLAVTDFPDIRFKAVIHSASGSAVLIPREGGYMFRLYIELDKLNDGERVRDRELTIEQLIGAAQRIFAPYALDVKEVPWWSVYEIGQRLCDKYDDVPDAEIAERTPQVFIAGDACHTHSPKAGQGMNVSMRDGFNLGWKLAGVLTGRYSPKILHTYSAERWAVASELIAFDREFAKLLSAPSKEPATEHEAEEGADPVEFQDHFQQAGRFTAGVATRYGPSMIVGDTTHQSLATGFTIGMRFHSAPVRRVADARPMELGHVVEADGRWRLFLFADRSGARLRTTTEHLSDDGQSPLRRFTALGADVDESVDVRAVLQQPHDQIDLAGLPAILHPSKGRYGLTDYQKVFCPDPKTGVDIFDLRGVDRASGAMVLVRPDQHVAHVLPLVGIDELAAFLGEIFLTS